MDDRNEIFTNFTRFMEGSWGEISIRHERDWQGILKIDSLKCNFIIMTDNILRKIIGELLASVVWKKLEELYFVKSLINYLYLKKRLYNIKMSECMPIK